MKTTALLLLSFSLLVGYGDSSDAYAFGAKKPIITKPEPAPTPKPPTTPTPPVTPPSTGPAQGTDYSALNSPWSNSETAIVIDAYQLNAINWDQMAKDKRVAAVIHRSSIGQRVDTKYVERKKIALERGYLWGAYHLGYKGNVKAQADLFISLIGNEADTLMILDLEDTTNGTFMTVDESISFVEYVHEKTGRIPVIYANHSTTKLLNTKVKNHPLFLQSKLWYARFTKKVTDYPTGVWPNYFLWQFSSEINCSKTGTCLYNVPGTAFDMDVNVFNGSAEELKAQWNNH